MAHYRIIQRGFWGEKKVQVQNHMHSDGITVQHEASNLAFGMALWLCEGIKSPYLNAH